MMAVICSDAFFQQLYGKMLIGAAPDIKQTFIKIFYFSENYSVMCESYMQKCFQWEATGIWNLQVPNWQDRFIFQFGICKFQIVRSCFCDSFRLYRRIQHFPFFIKCTHIPQITGCKAPQSGQFFTQLLAYRINCAFAPESQRAQGGRETTAAEKETARFIIGQNAFILPYNE